MPNRLLGVEVLGRIARAPHVLTLLDFDGTLAPIVTNPRDAAIPPRVRESIAVIERRSRATIGIISGRALDDLMERAGLAGLVYAGNNGNEVLGRGLRFVEPVALHAQPQLRALLEHLEPRLAHLPHVLIEDKSLTATLHVRGTSIAEREDAVRILRSAITAFPYLRSTMGIYALDIVPDNGWGKGAAVHWIRRELGLEDALVIYAGDDVPDEDAFAALAGHITVRIGPGATHAAYSVDSPVEIWDLLERIGEIVSP